MAHTETDPTPAEVHIHEGHEPNEVNLSVILQFGVWLVVASIVIAVGLWGLFRVFASMERREQPALATGVAASLARTPAAPRLEARPLVPRRQLNAEENETLTSYAWVDRPSGRVRIPIEAAMRMIAAQGVPGGKPLPPPTPVPTPPVASSAIGSGGSR